MSSALLQEAESAPLPPPGQGRRRERRALLSLMRYFARQAQFERSTIERVRGTSQARDPDEEAGEAWQAMAEEIARHVIGDSVESPETEVEQMARAR